MPICVPFGSGTGSPMPCTGRCGIAAALRSRRRETSSQPWPVSSNIPPCGPCSHGCGRGRSCEVTMLAVAASSPATCQRAKSIRRAHHFSRARDHARCSGLSRANERCPATDSSLVIPAAALRTSRWSCMVHVMRVSDLRDHANGRRGRGRVISGSLGHFTPRAEEHPDREAQDHQPQTTMWKYGSVLSAFHWLP